MLQLSCLFSECRMMKILDKDIRTMCILLEHFVLCKQVPHTIKKKSFKSLCSVHLEIVLTEFSILRVEHIIARIRKRATAARIPGSPCLHMASENCHRLNWSVQCASIIIE